MNNGVIASASLTTVHHFHARTDDLLPVRGLALGDDDLGWRAGGTEVLLGFAAAGAACCVLCLELARSPS